MDNPDDNCFMGGDDSKGSISSSGSSSSSSSSSDDGKLNTKRPLKVTKKRDKRAKRLDKRQQDVTTGFAGVNGSSAPP